MTTEQAVRNGKTRWTRHLQNLITQSNTALKAGKIETAQECLRRAKIAERTLAKWQDVHDEARRTDQLHAQYTIRAINGR